MNRPHFDPWNDRAEQVWSYGEETQSGSELPKSGNQFPVRCCNGNGWYTSYSGGFAHPMPCEYCNRQGLPPKLKPITTPVARIGSSDVWPPEVLAEIKRIYAEDEDRK